VTSNDPVIDIAYVLDKLYYSATDEHDKGDKFERLVRKFLLTEPVHADRFDEVWRWMDWPGRGKRPDHGIDLVARERETGDLVAVQCKFYDPAHYLTKPDIDSFLAESGHFPFRSRLVVSTTDRWNSAAEAAVQNQQIPVSRIGLGDLAESTIDWTQFNIETPDVLATKGRKQLRPHQRTALDKVRAGFQTGDRGQLIMACGTGKTFTSLRIAEDLVPLGGRVLFLVPSIALASQALKEWSAEADVSLRTFVVCSDTKVGKSEEDISVVDLAIPPTTDAAKLAERASDGSAGSRLTVVFSTYQSIEVIAAAQRDHGLPAFDLVVCDEAHRTTGAETADQERRSAFMAVHDQTYLHATKRLYMTATPRLYDDNSKAKAGQANALLASMDDESTYGPEFHRLGFGQAVSAGLLTDYKVMVLTVDEGAISATFQRDLETNGELNLPDVARIVGCWNALAKRMADDSFATDPEPMRRAVAFSSTIAASKRFSAAFESVVATYTEAIRLAGPTGVAQPLATHVHHVDGTMNMLAREHEMDWLKGQGGSNEARVLTNAKCLSEGVDVPALDAVMFLHPRKSVVDVVQSVGRVMRLAPGKQYGYIILPIAVPAGMPPEEALRDNERFRVVWEVLQALRAHDERFNALINQIDLNKNKPNKISIFHVGAPATDSDGGGAPDTTPARPVAVQPTFQLEALDNWREAIYARMVEKVGSRRYWETWAKDVADIVAAHTTRLRTLIANPATPEVNARFEQFVIALRANLNDSITTGAAIDMLSQHMVTRPVFDALFPGYAFTDHNPVARVMQDMLEVLEGSNLEAETERLAGFYESVRVRAEGIDNAAGKQQVVTELYERFFQLAFPKTSDALGIVYTPVQIVDFIIRSVNDLLITEFNTSLTAPGVHALDPFTGTGTLISRLLSSGLIDPADLARKYTSELHANEITLLAYYIAAANIEATYHDLTTPAGDPAKDGTWAPFDGIVLADTFQMTETDDALDGQVFATNSERAEAQRDLDIRVIVANPPYSVGQTTGNDNNANLKYPTLDARIEHTYAAKSTATNKNSLYDSYIRAIRWASDRIGDAGIIGYVTNGGFIDANTTDGLRKTLTDEFASIYIYNLRGNARTAGEQRQKEKGNVFGSGARTTVAITLLVKHPDHTGPAVVRYHDIGDYLTREAKLDLVEHAHLATLPWQTITPNAAGDWINQRGDEFETYTPLGDRNPGRQPVFTTFSGGVKTNRDAWVYNFSSREVGRNVERMVDFYNSQVDHFATFVDRERVRDPKDLVEGFIDTDPTKISWNRADKSQLARGRHYQLRQGALRPAAYRPFTRQSVWFDPELNDMVYRIPAMFPTPNHPNHGFVVMAPRPGTSFAVVATDLLPDLSFFTYTGQFFARYTYELVKSGDEQGAFDLLTPDAVVIDGYRRLDNITDDTLATYRRWYGAQVTKDDVFAFVYGLLHSTDYRERFAADLKRSLPRIPRIAAEDFPKFRDAGQTLLALHINYEQAEPYPLTITGDQPAGPGSGDLYGWFTVDKLRWGGASKTKDRSTIVYNPRITITGIPDTAHEYMLGSRTALEWILDRYQVHEDKPSGIVNDPNDYSREVANPRYILDLIAKVTTVSVHTVEIVNDLPPLRIVEDQP
jgi:predicted helicase